MNATHEKIFERECGAKVRVRVELNFHNGPQWWFKAYRKEKRKRTWTTPVNHDDYSWRLLDGQARIDEDHRRCLTICTREEVLETMTELWESLSPDKLRAWDVTSDE